MENYIVEKRYAIPMKSGSKGSQPKYFKDGYWYKTDCVGCEGLAEEIVSDLLNYSNLINFVHYERCLINGLKGCRSRDFTNGGDLVTFNRIYKNTTLGGKELTDHLFTYRDVSDRIEMLLNLVGEFSGLDATEYLYNNIALDLLIRNPDRHMDNLALVCRDGVYSFPPIFDNGQGLGCNYTITPPGTQNDIKDSLLTACTISGSFDLAYSEISKRYNGKRLRIDYSRAAAVIERNSYLKYNLGKYKSEFDMSGGITPLSFFS